MLYEPGRCVAPGGERIYPANGVFYDPSYGTTYTDEGILKEKLPMDMQKRNKIWESQQNIKYGT